MSKQMRNSAARPAPEIVDFKEAYRDQVSNLLVLEPKIRAADAAARLAEESEPDLLEALKHHLVLQYFIRAVNQYRAIEAAARRDDQLLLPGFEHLPRKILAKEGKRLPLAKARYSDLKAHLETLNRQHSNAAQVVEIKAAMKLMRRYAKKHRGITFEEVARLEREKK